MAAVGRGTVQVDPQGKHIHVNLIPMGSLEGAHAALNGDQRIQVWSPASAVYKDTFVEDWQAKYGSNPILKEDALALTPMVFVMWEERYQAFKDHYGTVDFDTINRALHEPGGWKRSASIRTGVFSSLGIRIRASRTPGSWRCCWRGTATSRRLKISLSPT